MENTLTQTNGTAGAAEAGKLLPRAEAGAPARGRGRLLALGGLVAALLAGGGWYAAATRGWESTDDAFIEGHVVPVSPKVSGHVARVLVDDNQAVAKGQLLAEIQPDDYATRRDQARAKVRGARARSKQARADLARYRALADKDEASRQTLDNAEAAADSADADLAAAEADLRQAELNLSYTRIEAPQAGRVTRKSVEEGAFVNVGQGLLAIVPEQVWVIANFKETELRGMKPGQRAEIDVDAGSGKLSGRVDSIQSGTGARFSLLPPENATGNYVKVVQRVPVKILLDDARGAGLLAPGLSVEAKVEVK